MTEQEFAAIRHQWMESRTLGTDEHIDWLIRAIDERDAIIHDLTLDGSALARRAVEEFAAELVDRLAVIARDVAKRTSATNYGKWLGVQDAINLVSALTKVGTIDPLPPDRVRQENERLRERLREIVEEITEYGEPWPDLRLEDSPLPVLRLLSCIREMASEEATR